MPNDPQSGKDTHTQVHKWAAALTVLAVSLAVFAPISSFQFSSIDDGINIYLNSHIKNPAAQDIGYFWRHPYFELYMPVTYCFWALCAHIAPLSAPRLLPVVHETSKLNPGAFHALSLVFHGLNALLVFGVLSRLKFRPWPSACGALLFALHPIQVQAVAWITGFNNLSSGFFCLLALNLYLRAIPERERIHYDGNSPEASPENEGRVFPGPYWPLLALATFCFGLALLSKPTATILPVFVVILEVVAFRRPVRRWIGLTGLWLLMALGCVVVTSITGYPAAPDFWSPLWGRPFVAGDALSFYVGKLVVPIHFTFDYVRSPKVVLRAWWGYVTWILPAAIAVLLWRKWPRAASAEAGPSQRSLQVAFLIFVAGLAPVLGIIPFYSQPVSTVFDRFAYLAMLGPAIALASLCSHMSPRFTRTIVAVAVVLFIVLASRTVIEEFVWTDAYSLTMNMLEESPESAMAQHLAGGILTYREDYEGALARLLLSKRLEPIEISATDQDLAFTLVHLGRFPEAVAPLERAINYDLYHDEHWELLWFVISHLRKFDSIEAWMHRRLQANPREGRAEFTLGVIRMQRENAAAALPDMEAGARDAPEFAEIHSDLGAVYVQLNRLVGAETQFEFALHLDPENKDARTGLESLRKSAR